MRNEVPSGSGQHVQGNFARVVIGRALYRQSLAVRQCHNGRTGEGGGG